MAPYEVFSAPALRHILRHDEIIRLRSDDDVETSEVVAVSAGDIRYWVSSADTTKTRKLVFRVGELFLGLSNVQTRAVLERSLNASERAITRPFQVPQTWHTWNKSDRVAFYAAAKGRIKDNPRWIAQIFLQDGDVFFWDLYPGEQTPRHLLEDEQIDTGEYYRAVANWDEAIRSANALRTLDRSSPPAAAVTLSVPSIVRGSGPTTYSEWLESEHLTSEQRQFITADSQRSVRLKGPAGSGKTLSLELKALREARRLSEQKPNVRVLFATHSWAMAEQIQDDLRRLDDVGVSGGVHVLPLLEIVRDVRPPAEGLEILGSDSHEGREYQELSVRMAVEEYLQGDWDTLKDRTTSDFRRDLESLVGPDPTNRHLLDDLVTEFSVVMGGEGIQDGPRDESKYLEVQRGPWCMEFSSRVDMQAAYGIYREFLGETRRASLLTSDQFMSSALHWFADFEWGALRAARGFDSIFVDELHLFNPQERGVLNYLGSDSSVYPRLFMSLDPLQSTSGRFGAPHADKAIVGEQDSVELREIHRFSPQILRLVRHINDCIPTEDFGEEWGVDLAGAHTSAPDGPKPLLIKSSTPGNEPAAAFSAASSALERVSRVAIAIVEPSCAGPFFAMAEELAEDRGRSVATIRTRDDLGVLNYSARGLVVGRAEDLAGLQFSEVVVAGMGDVEQIQRLTHRRLSFMSSLYVAVSRAADAVTIVVDDEASGIPTVLKEASRHGILTEAAARR